MNENAQKEENPPNFENKTDEPIEVQAYQETMAKAGLYHLVYIDSKKEKTERDIEIQRFEMDGDRFYVFAYCHMAKAIRQFSVDRIFSLSAAGKKIKNPQQFLLNLYHDSPIYQTQMALNKHTDEILVLVFMARSDGKMLKNEREVIVRYIDIIVPGIEAEAAEEMIKNTICELSQFNGILKRSKEWKPETKALVMDCVSQLFMLKKQPDPMEKATFEKLQKALA